MSEESNAEDSNPEDSNPEDSNLGFLIDDEFSRLLSKTAETCNEDLESLIKEAGCAREELVVWDEPNILIDGHRRLAICRRLGLPYRVRRISCKDRKEAKFEAWRIQHSRRNASDHDQAIYVAMRARNLKEDLGMSAAEAAESISQEDGTSTRTVRRHVKYGKAFDRLEDHWQTTALAHNFTREMVSTLSAMTTPNRKHFWDMFQKDGPSAFADRERRLKKQRAKQRRRLEKRKSKEMVAPFEELEVPPEIKKAKKDDRIGQLLEKSESATAAAIRAVYHLFGESGIADPGHALKRRIDKGFREVVKALDETRNKYG